MFDLHDLKPTFSNRGGAALLHLRLPPLPQEIEFGGTSWIAKREFHVTLIGRAMLAALAPHITPEATHVEAAFARAGRNVPFRVHSLAELWRIEEEEKRSIIQLCEVEGGETFYQRLEEMLKITIGRPPLHVTLFTAGTRKGIGIASEEMLRELGRRLTEEEVHQLRAALHQ